MAVGDRQPSLRSRSANEHSLALAREWKKLGRLATAIALLTSPILYAAIATTLEWRWYWCALASLAAVVIFRGMVDVLAHRWIPSPAIYGAETALARDDVVSRRPGELPSFPAMFFRRGDLRGELGVPLEATLPAAAPRPEQIDLDKPEAKRIDVLTRAKFFTASFQQAQDASVFLVLDR